MSEIPMVSNKTQLQRTCLTAVKHWDSGTALKIAQIVTKNNG